MTREEAKNDVQALIDFFNNESGATPVCLEYCLDILEQQPCEDCVSRKAIENIKEDIKELLVSQQNELEAKYKERQIAFTSPYEKCLVIIDKHIGKEKKNDDR